MPLDLLNISEHHAHRPTIKVLPPGLRVRNTVYVVRVRNTVYVVERVRNTVYVVRVRNTVYVVRVRNTVYVVRVRNTVYVVERVRNGSSLKSSTVTLLFGREVVNKEASVGGRS